MQLGGKVLLPRLEGEVNKNRVFVELAPPFMEEETGDLEGRCLSQSPGQQRPEEGKQPGVGRGGGASGQLLIK